MVDYKTLPATTRVWIYQSNKDLADDIAAAISLQIDNFVGQWTAHNNALRAWGQLMHNRFIVLMVDESQAGASGCSIDKSVAFVKAVEQATGAEFFDRFNFAYKLGSELKSASRDIFEALYKKGEIIDSTIVFNNLVQTKAEFEEKWQIPLSESWHKNFV